VSKKSLKFYFKGEKKYLRFFSVKKFGIQKNDLICVIITHYYILSRNKEIKTIKLNLTYEKEH
jgi:hypothetical protein